MQAQGDSLHKYEGPDHISDANLEHAKRRELELQAQQEHQSKQIEANAKHEMTEKRLQLLQQCEAPWSWIHEFTQQNNLKKSYNFIELDSIPSNVTPSESSDESFDFERGKFISSASSDTTLESEDSCEVGVEKQLITKRESESTLKSDAGVMANDFLNEIIETIITDKKIDISVDTKSLLELLEQQIGGDANHLNMASLERYLLEAENKGMKFRDLKHLHDYLKEKFGVADDEIGTDAMASASCESSVQADNETELVVESEGLEVAAVPIEDDNVEPITVKSQLESKFGECDIDIDDNVAKKSVSDNMILGLVDSKEGSTIVEESVASEPLSPSTITEKSSKIQQTSPMPSTAESSDTEEPVPEMEVSAPIFGCTVEVLPGIGKGISKRTQQNFLTYLKGRSQDERGMVFPRHFKERKCPNMVCCNEE